MKLNPPTPWQQKTFYSALAALSILAIFWVVTVFFEVAVDAIKRIQPFLIPVAIAVVLAYLLEPVVKKLCTWKLSRTSAVLIVFGVFIVFSTFIFFWVAPVLYDQGVTFWQRLSDSMPKALKLIDSTVKRYQAHADNQYMQAIQDWLQSQLPDYTTSVLSFVRNSFGGALQIFGFIVGLMIVPLYLFYFLQEAAQIEKNGAIICRSRPRVSRMNWSTRSTRSTSISSLFSADNCW